MAVVVLGNLTLQLDLTSSRTTTINADRKTRPVSFDLVSNLPKREHQCHNFAPLFDKSADTDGETRYHRVVTRGKSNSRVNAFNFESNSSDEDGEYVDDEEEKYNWEDAMKERMKDLEEMQELEKKAEELQNKIEDSEGDSQDETEEEKRTRVKKELEKVAQEQAERRATAEMMFELGQKAYGKGSYGRSIEFLEGALTIIPRPTLFGGEIQIWLAMAYEANNRHGDCIALYQQLEKKHPSTSIRRQAGELRYILQAPKLKITREEMVTIPMIGSSYDSYAVTWTEKDKDRNQQRSGSITTNQLRSSKDYLVWQPPGGWEKNRTFWIGVTIGLGLLGAALFLQR